jgi:hypothetical protein
MSEGIRERGTKEGGDPETGGDSWKVVVFWTRV